MSGIIASTYEIKTAWEVWTTENEYGRHGSLVGYFGSEKSAKEAAVGRGWYGGEGAVIAVNVIRVPGGEIYALKDAQPIVIDRDLPKFREAIKVAAMNKLSDVEKRVLGLIK